MSNRSRVQRLRNPKASGGQSTKRPFFNPPKKTVQRLATSKQDEKLSTNDSRMEKDKEDPQKPSPHH